MTFLKSNILGTKLLQHTNRKLYLTYRMVLCLVTLIGLYKRARRAGLSASAELLVETRLVMFSVMHFTQNRHAW